MSKLSEKDRQLLERIPDSMTRLDFEQRFLELTIEAAKWKREATDSKSRYEGLKNNRSSLLYMYEKHADFQRQATDDEICVNLVRDVKNDIMRLKRADHIFGQSEIFQRRERLELENLKEIISDTFVDGTFDRVTKDRSKRGQVLMSALNYGYEFSDIVEKILEQDDFDTSLNFFEAVIRPTNAFEDDYDPLHHLKVLLEHESIDPNGNDEEDRIPPALVTCCSRKRNNQCTNLKFHQDC